MFITTQLLIKIDSRKQRTPPPPPPPPQKKWVALVLQSWMIKVVEMALHMHISCLVKKTKKEGTSPPVLISSLIQHQHNAGLCACLTRSRMMTKDEPVVRCCAVAQVVPSPPRPPSTPAGKNCPVSRPPFVCSALMFAGPLQKQRREPLVSERACPRQSPRVTDSTVYKNKGTFMSFLQATLNRVG